jgi:hypothetical protein
MRIPRSVIATTAIGAVLAGGGVALATASSAGAAPVTDVVSAVTTTDAGPVAKAKGLRDWWGSLTDTQQACLKDANLTRPVGPLTLEQRRALRADVKTAAATCNVELPKLGPVAAFWNGLTQEQITCLQDTGLTRPLGRLTKADRRDLARKLVAAADTCGVTPPKLPTGPATATSSSLGAL